MKSSHLVKVITVQYKHVSHMEEKHDTPFCTLSYAFHVTQKHVTLVHQFHLVLVGCSSGFLHNLTLAISFVTVTHPTFVDSREHVINALITPLDPKKYYYSAVTHTTLDI